MKWFEWTPTVAVEAWSQDAAEDIFDALLYLIIDYLEEHELDRAWSVLGGLTCEVDEEE